MTLLQGNAPTHLETGGLGVYHWFPLLTDANIGGPLELQGGGHRQLYLHRVTGADHMHIGQNPQGSDVIHGVVGGPRLA
jgi:hypothetical protein